MRDLRVTIKRDARRSLQPAWSRAIVILLILVGIRILFLMLDKGVQSFFPILPPNSWDELLLEIRYISPVYIAVIFLIGLMRWIVMVPLNTGTLKWYLNVTDGITEPVSEIFSPFGNRLFGRSIYLQVLLAIISIFWSVLFVFLPSAVIYYGVNIMMYIPQTPEKNIVTVMCLILGSILLLISFILLSAFLTRYTLAPYLITSRYDYSPLEAIRLSVKYTKGHRWELFTLGLSFIPWILLCFLLLPIFYVAPYTHATYAIYARYLIEIGKRGEAPFTQEFEPQF